MKKILAALLVLALVAPAMANVAVTATDEGTGHLKIKIAPTGGAVVRGIALKLTRTAGDAVIDATADVTCTQFNTFIDYAFDNSGYTIGTGHAIADPAAAGVATLPASTFSLSAGYLDQAGNQAGVTVDSFFDVFFTQTASSTIGIALDTLRGGIVGDTLGTVTVQASQTLAAAPTDCVKSTAPFYADWVAFSKPSCWCFQRQCRGDANGAIAGPYWVSGADLTIFKNAFNKTDALLPAGGICADFNHAAAGPYRVSGADLTIFKTYFNKDATIVTVCDNANYNFWTN